MRKAKNILTRGAVLAMGLIMVLSMSVGSFAYSTPANVATKTSNKATLSVGKTYDGVRAAEFQFRIDAIEAFNSDTNAAISKANMPLASGETKTISYTAASSESKEKSASFSQMTFTQPGWYMYRVNEVIPTTKIDGVKYDDSFYYVVVYVQHQVDASTGLTSNDVVVKEITSWHNKKGENVRPNLTDLANVTDNGGNEAANNAAGNVWGKVNFTKFVNVQDFNTVTVSKSVFGSLGSTTQDFNFSIALEGLGANQTYNIVKGAKNIPVTSNASGVATGTFTLKNGETVSIDLPIGATYTVTELANNHKASLKVTADGASPVIATGTSGNGVKANETANTALSTAKETVNEGDGDVTVAVKNEREWAPITGVPAIDGTICILGAIVVVGAIAMLLIRRRRFADDME